MGIGKPTGVQLDIVVRDFARALKAVDSRKPIFTGPRGRTYQPGVGPHSEDRAVDLIVAEMQSEHPERYGRTLECRKPYSVGSRQTCDLVLRDQWMIEVKMARFYFDNNKPDDTSLKDLLSPFQVDRSAFTDCAKLVAVNRAERKAIVIYGFEAPARPLTLAIRAFEALARTRVALGPRITAPYSGLVHPVFREGAVFGWEVRPLSS